MAALSARLHLTLETLDTLVKYSQLHTGRQDKSIATAFASLRYRFDDSSVIQTVMDGKMAVQSARWFLRNKYRDNSITMSNDAPDH